MTDLRDIIAFAIIFVFVVLDKVHTYGIIKAMTKTNADMAKKLIARNLAELSQFNAEEVKQRAMGKAVGKEVKKAEKEKESIDSALESLRNTPEIV